jgi:DNA-binding NarL/FixJ family response regulator
MLVDDHVLIRIGLTYSLNAQPNYLVVGEASDGESALRVYRQCRPDLVLLDLRMPGAGGLETLSKLRQIDPEARVLVLTNYGSGDEVEAALQAGAAGFLLKDTPLEGLIAAIETVRSGGQHLSSSASTRLARHLSSQLTQREADMLRLIGRGLNNKQIAHELELSEPTVKAHVGNLLAKLNVSDRTQALLAGVRRGLLHID